MDRRLGSDVYDSFKKYQTLLIEEFDKMAEKFAFEAVDARKSPEEIQEMLRVKLSRFLLSDPFPQSFFPCTNLNGWGFYLLVHRSHLRTFSDLASESILYEKEPSRTCLN